MCSFGIICQKAHAVSFDQTLQAQLCRPPVENFVQSFRKLYLCGSSQEPKQAPPKQSIKRYRFCISFSLLNDEDIIVCKHTPAKTHIIGMNWLVHWLMWHLCLVSWLVDRLVSGLVGSIHQFLSSWISPSRSGAGLPGADLLRSTWHASHAFRALWWCSWAASAASNTVGNTSYWSRQDLCVSSDPVNPAIDREKENNSIAVRSAYWGRKISTCTPINHHWSREETSLSREDVSLPSWGLKEGRPWLEKEIPLYPIDNNRTTSQF